MRMITLTPKISSVETKNGVALSVSGVAQVLSHSISLKNRPAQLSGLVGYILNPLFTQPFKSG